MMIVITNSNKIKTINEHETFSNLKYIKRVQNDLTKQSFSINRFYCHKYNNPILIFKL